MKTDLPSFIGARLKEAREARCITQTNLAQMLGISKAAMSSYETGKTSPGIELIQKMGQTLNIPASYFSVVFEYEESPTPLFFRSMAATTTTARKSSERKHVWVRNIFNYLNDYLQFPVANIPAFNLDSNIDIIGDEDIERIASETRKYYKLQDGPISNIIYLLENNGIRVSRFDMNSDSLDAFSRWEGESGDLVPYISLNSGKNSCARSRLDAVHELGHLILHSQISPELINKASEFKLMENQAFRFAGAFLLPAETFADEVNPHSLDSMIRLKAQWKVSLGAMLTRAFQLDLIDEASYRRQWMLFSRRGYRKSEPLDDVLEPEKPVLLGKAVNLMIDEGFKTRTEILEDLSLSAIDIEEFCSLPEGFFDDSPKIFPKAEHLRRIK